MTRSAFALVLTSLLAFLAGCNCTETSETVKSEAIMTDLELNPLSVPRPDCGRNMIRAPEESSAKSIHETDLDLLPEPGTNSLIQALARKMLRDQALRDERARQLRTERRLYRPGGFTLKGIVCGSTDCSCPGPHPNQQPSE